MPDAQNAYGGLIRRFHNLAGVPSYHYEPVFAAAVRVAFDEVRPTVVAVECPPSVLPELQWAADRWPEPVVSLSGNTFFPGVPGDSMLEACRLARDRGIEIVGTDLDVDRDLLGQEHSDTTSSFPLPGPEFAPQMDGDLFLQTVDAVLAAEDAEPLHLAREAHMAAALFSLMEQYEWVLWVGGMAHWSRILQRLEQGDLVGPSMPLVAEREFRRMRLGPSALHRMTGHIPRFVRRYGDTHETYDEDREIRELALDAARAGETGVVAIVSLPGQNSAAIDPINLDREEASPADVARMLLYARNLALTAVPRERPNLGELLTAAVSTVGSRYAGRLYILAMDQASRASSDLRVLEWTVEGDRAGYRCGEEWLSAEPWWPALGSSLTITYLTVQQVTEERAWVPYDDLGEVPECEKHYWGAYPADEIEYERFVEYVLRRASVVDPGEVHTLPFTTGLLDGLEARETIRHWRDGDIYVREEQRGHMAFTNGVIDWDNEREDSPLLRGEIEGGWIDPDCFQVGSASYEGQDYEVVQESPYFLQVNTRRFSLISLDATTSIKPGQSREKSFYDQVIRGLLAIQHTPDNNLYGWLDVMFRFSAGKALVYYSRYVPSPRVYALAARYNVRVLHIPLRQIPRRLRQRNQSFRFLEMPISQWNALASQMARQGLWDMVRVLQSHGAEPHLEIQPRAPQ